jgi:hypothetical protein
MIAITMAEPMPRQPHRPLGQVAFQHRLIGMTRIVVDRDDAAGRVFRQLLGDLEIAEVLADRNAVAAELAAAHGIFVSDVGEVAALGAVAVLALVVGDLDLAHLGNRGDDLAGHLRPAARLARLPGLHNGGNQDQRQRRKQHRVNERR